GRPDEDMRIVTLAEAEGGMADMATCVIIGSPATRIVERNGLPPLVYSPRSAG
ncbi:MAG: precorrin-3B C(17)-methyltransferase, partial [Rhizobiales bacterium 12-68-15]